MKEGRSRWERGCAGNQARHVSLRWVAAPVRIDRRGVHATSDDRDIIPDIKVTIDRCIISADFIEKASGIKQRYTYCKGGILDIDRMRPKIPLRRDDELSHQAEMALAAARIALDRANKSPAEIDMVIVSCAYTQRAYPAIAIEVQHQLLLGQLQISKSVVLRIIDSAMRIMLILAVTLEILKQPFPVRNTF